MSYIPEMPPEISSIIKLGDGDYLKIEQILQELENATVTIVKCRSVADLLSQTNHNDDYTDCTENSLCNIASVMYDLCDDAKKTVSSTHENLKRFLTEKRLEQLD